jgi:transmembrane sensor
MDETFTPPHTERSRQRTLDEEAAAWLLALEDNTSNDIEARFRCWLERSADHMQTFLEVTAVDRDLQGMDRDRQIDLESLIAAVRKEGAPNVVALSRHSENGDPAVAPIRRRSGLRLAAAIVGLGVLSGLFLWARHGEPTSYTTALGEQRAVKLDDGSLMHLNTRSHIEVNFTAQTREVTLLEGEALFVVERDSKRPFRVISGSTVVQAVGTQFNVYRQAESTTVSVIEGRVKISEAAHKLVLNAGEAANVQSSGKIAKQHEGQVAKATSWRQRQLSFDHDSLDYVAEQFNRYNRVQIRIADPEVSRRELEGIFNADEPQALLDFLTLEKDLRFERAGNTISIHLRSK